MGRAGAASKGQRVQQEDKAWLPASMTEGDGTYGGSVMIPGTYASDRVVDLLSDDTTEIVVPGTVTIPAGDSEARPRLPRHSGMPYDHRRA